MTLFNLHFISTHSGNYQHQTIINIVTTLSYLLSILQPEYRILFYKVHNRNQQQLLRVTNNQQHHETSDENICNFV